MTVDATELEKMINQATMTLENYQKQAQTDKIRANDVCVAFDYIHFDRIRAYLGCHIGVESGKGCKDDEQDDCRCIGEN